MPISKNLIPYSMNPDTVADDMLRLLIEWYARTDVLIEELARKYGADTSTTYSPAEQVCSHAVWTAQQPEEQ